MKRISLVLTAAVAVIFITSCHKTPKDDCIECQGCFGGWEECRESYTGPLTWEAYRDAMLSLGYNVTIHCERKN